MNMITGSITLSHKTHVDVRDLSPYAVDQAIRRYLPNSPVELRKLLEQKVGGAADFSDVGTVTELLIYLAACDSGQPACIKGSVVEVRS